MTTKKRRSDTDGQMTAPIGAELSLSELLRLDDKVAVVTGGASGIGASTVARLVEAGSSVVIGDLQSGLYTSDKLTVVEKDLSRAEAADELAEAVLQTHGRMDIWINNAGVYPTAHILDMTDAEWGAVLELNLNAAFRGSRAAARIMSNQKEGVIVNIASNAGMASGRSTAHYVTSKHGIVGLTKSLAVDLAPYGIRSVGIAPGVTMTDGLANAMSDLAKSGWGDIEAYARRSTPLGRMADPDEVARVVVFAVSRLAQYITGTTIVVDGGQLISFT